MDFRQSSGCARRSPALLVILPEKAYRQMKAETTSHAVF